MDNLAFWIIQVPGWLLFFYLAVTQCPAAISYQLGVRMGSQEPAERSTPVGVAFWWGFCVGDLVFYTPLLGAGLIGQAIGKSWGTVALVAALGVTVYWPLVCLAAARRASGAPGWSLPNERQFWMVLPVIVGWALLALILLIPTAG